MLCQLSDAFMLHEYNSRHCYFIEFSFSPVCIWKTGFLQPQILHSASFVASILVLRENIWISCSFMLPTTSHYSYCSCVVPSNLRIQWETLSTRFLSCYLLPCNDLRFSSQSQRCWKRVFLLSLQFASSTHKHRWYVMSASAAASAKS